VTKIEPHLQALVDQVQATVREAKQDMLRATVEMRCVKPPAGCGQPIGHFLDEASQREYGITGLCQLCQDKLFAPFSEADVADRDADPDVERCIVCGEYRDLIHVDVGVGSISGHNCCADIRFGDTPKPPRCTLTPGCQFCTGHVHTCEIQE
jgi:hypothetical protein